MNKNYIKQVWTAAVAEAESDLMRACPTLIGGKRSSETAEQYAERCKKAIDDALDRLATARAMLKEVKP